MDDKPIKVLLIEDSLFATQHTQRMLAKAKSAQFSAELKCADQLSVGLEHLAEGGVDIVLLDLTLPDSAELDTFTKVHTQAPNLPIVVMSGIEDETLAIEAVQKGAQDYLVKGQVDSNLLKRSILYAIERKRAEEELRKTQDKLKAFNVQLEETVMEKTASLKEKIADNEQMLGRLRTVSQQWYTTFNAIVDAICVLDTEAKVLQCNKAMEELTGKPIEEMVGRNCCELVHGSPEHLEGCPMVRMPKSLKRESLELNLEETWLQVTVDPVLDGEGELVGAVHVIANITERKRVEQELQKHKVHLEGLVRERTDELQKIVNLMAGREVRMAGLKETITKLRAQLKEVGLTPVADDPLKEMGRVKSEM